MCSLDKTLLAFDFFILNFKEKLVCYSGYLSTSYICILIPYNEKDIFFLGGGGVLVLEGLVGLHRTVQLQLLQHYWLGHRLRLLQY